MLKQGYENMSTPSRFTFSTAIAKTKRVIQGIRQSFFDSPKEQTLDTAIGTPEDTLLGHWKKHMFIAPAFDDEQLVAKLDYYIFTPASTPERPTTKGMPLVVMLHGCSQTAKDFAAGTQMNFLAQQEGFVVLYPQQSISYNLGKCWRWYDLDDSKGVAEAHTIMKIIQSTISMHELEPTKVFIAGMSAGAGMASIIAAIYPGKIQAIALHSGPALAIAHNMKSGLSLLKNGFDDSDEKSIANLAPFAHKESHETPTIIIYGQEDNVVHVNNSDALSKQFLYLNNIKLNTKGLVTKHFSGTDKEYTQTEYKDGQHTIVNILRVKHLSHAWSGGDSQYPFHTDKGPQASRLIWDFFKESLAQSKTNA